MRSRASSATGAWTTTRRTSSRSIPGKAVVDVRIGGEIDKFFWSVSVQNVFNTLYFDYAIASAFTFGRYSAYPLPGRTFLVRAGMQF